MTDKGWGFRQLDRATDVAGTTVRTWVRDIDPCEPKIEAFGTVCAALGVRMEWVRTGERVKEFFSCHNAHHNAHHNR